MAEEKPAMKIMTYQEFKELSKKDRYLKRWWHYYKKVIALLQTISFESCLKLGAYKQAIVHGADVIDKRRHVAHLTYQHDVTEIPWPIADAQYDLFIALQVWEHLEGKQQVAFGEVMRIAKMAVLSFPLEWHCPGNVHHGITEETIAAWTLQVRPVRKIETVRWNFSLYQRIRRLICFYDFGK